jgi:uncharacterized membrane protein
MNQFVLLAGISVPIFIVLDLLWLGVVAKSFYQAKLVHLLGPVVWPAAIAFYAVFITGLTYFATYPAVMHSSLREAMYLGAMYGFFTYATYDLTNHATLRSWPLSVTIVDIVWGTLLGAAVALLTAFVYMHVTK